MSNALTNKVKRIKSLSFSEKSILFRLADESRDGITVCIGIQLLAGDAGCSERTAQMVLRRLETKKIIIAIGTRGGRGHVTAYRIALENAESITVDADLPVQPIQQERQTALMTLGVLPTPPTAEAYDDIPADTDDPREIVAMGYSAYARMMLHYRGVSGRALLQKYMALKKTVEQAMPLEAL